MKNMEPLTADAKPTFTSVSVQEGIPDTEPKRRGRPPLTPEQKEERTRARGTDKAPRRAVASLELRIGAQITQVNIVLMMLPWTRYDALDPAEITLLARAIDDQCRSSATFRKYVELILSASSGASLITVIAMIGARRAARHGMIPEALDEMIGNQMAEAARVKPTAPPVIEKRESGEVVPVDEDALYHEEIAKNLGRTSG